MTERIFKIFCILAFVGFSNVSFAADEFSDDLSLDDQFNDASVPPPAPSDAQIDPMDDFTTSPELSPSSDFTASQDLTPQSDDQSENVNLASPVEVRQRGGALFGFSAGLILASQSYNEKYTSDFPQGKVSVNRSTDNIQSYGVLLRYAIAPFNTLGTDLNISYAKSQNHAAITVDKTAVLNEITTLKGELNFTYALDIGGTLPIYFLLGFGAEKISGSEILKIINEMGYGGQAGAGFAINSTLNLEALYSYYVHRISQTTAINEGKKTSNPNPIDTEEAEVINQGLIVRGSFSFNF